jgi:hypothetical protein
MRNRYPAPPCLSTSIKIADTSFFDPPVRACSYGELTPNQRTATRQGIKQVRQRALPPASRSPPDPGRRCQASGEANVSTINRGRAVVCPVVVCPALQPCLTPPVRTSLRFQGRAPRAARAGRRTCNSAAHPEHCPGRSASAVRSWLGTLRALERSPAAGPAAFRPCRATAAPGSRRTRGDRRDRLSAADPALVRRCRWGHPSDRSGSSSR